MIVTYAGWDAMDASLPHDERQARRRQSRVVLAPRCWRQVGDDASHHTGDGGNKPVTGKSTI
jgi:hypothetical protein